MSEVAVLSKILNSGPCQQGRNTNAKNNAFDSKQINQPLEMDAESSSVQQSESQETGSVFRQDTSNKEFGRIYEDAIKQSNKEPDSESQNNQTDSSPETLEQTGVAEQKPPIETASGIPMIVLETPASAKESGIEPLKPQPKSTQQGASVQQQTPLITPAASAEPQTASIQIQTAAGQEQNTDAQMPQNAEDSTKQPADITITPNQPQVPELPIQAQNNQATAMPQQQSGMQSNPQQTDFPANQSDNTAKQLPEKPIESGPPERVPVPEHVEISNETARDRLAQPLPRGVNGVQFTPNAAAQAAASEGHKTQLMDEAEKFQISGEQKPSHEKPVTEIAETHQPTNPPGQEIRNMVSVEHVAQPSENASVQAAQTPSRLGTVTESDAAATSIKPIDQIAQRINAEWNGTDQSIRLTLTPAQLGTVRITFSRIDDEMIGMLEVQKAETRRQIEEALPQLVSTIQESGVPLRKVELLQWDANPQNGKDDQPNQYDLSQQREFSHSDTSDSSMSGRGQSRGQSNPVSRTGQSKSFNRNDFDSVEVDEGLNLFI